jgi:1-acyl-sn-glycerol-3-phosphate acyltransferase
MEQNMINRIISISFLGFICISSICLFVVALLIWLLTVLFDKRLTILHLFSSFWASIYIWLMPAWSVSVKGKAHIDKNKTYVIISNHQSLLDILVAFRIFFHFKWVSKVEIFRIPFIGWNMHLNNYIALRRGDKGSVQQMFDDCNKAISRGSSVFMFPEGTRSKNRELKSFKTGAFILAKDNHVPILPIAISGTREALPKHSLNFHGKKHIIVEILPEVSSEIVDRLSLEELSAKVHSVIQRQVTNNYAIIDAKTVQ